MFFVAMSYGFMYGSLAPRCSALIWGASHHLPGLNKNGKQVSHSFQAKYKSIYKVVNAKR